MRRADGSLPERPTATRQSPDGRLTDAGGAHDLVRLGPAALRSTIRAPGGIPHGTLVSGFIHSAARPNRVPAK